MKKLTPSGKTVIKSSGGKKQKKESLEEWAERYCFERGFTLDFAVRHHVQLLDEAQARSARCRPAGAGLYFRATDPVTRTLLPGGRLRYQHPPTIGKDVRKFAQPPKTESVPYFATSSFDWKRIFRDASARLFITEGETRALAGAKHTLPVIALGGKDSGFDAGTERGRLVPLLRDIVWKDRDVYVVPDADFATNPDVRKAYDRLAALLYAEGAKVRIVGLPPLTADGKTGLDDLLATPGGWDIFQPLCEAAPLWNAVTSCEHQPEIIDLADVESEPVPWLWEGYLAYGMLNLFSGDPGSAKTFLALTIAASFSRGEVPYLKRKCDPVTTLYMSIENAAKYVTKPRFTAAGGDPRRFHMLVNNITLSNVEVIEAAIKQTNAKLLIIDPLQSYLGANVDAHKSNQTRPVMDGLIRIAERHSVAILLIRHIAKAPGGRAIHRGLGSIDFTGAARLEMMVGCAADHPNDRAIAPIKNNVGPLAPSLAFTITGRDMEARLEWQGESALRAADLTAPESTKKSKTQAERAADYLREQLVDGPRPMKELLNEEFSERVLQLGAALAGVCKTRQGQRGPVMWGLKPRKFEIAGRANA